MSREVGPSGHDKPRKRPWFAVGVAGCLLSVAACASAIAPAVALDAPSIEYESVDGSIDGGGVGDGGGVPNAPTGCSLVRATPTSSVACRADWSCPGLGLYSFTCGEPDGGGVVCYCRLNLDLQYSGPGGCGDSVDAVATAAVQVCNWTFLSQPSDGGGSQ